MPGTEPKPAKGGSLGWALGLVAIIAFALGAAIYGGGGTQPAPQASGPQLGGDFALRDSAGRTVTLASLGGKPYAIYFGYTRCPDVCPTSLARLARLRQKLGKDGDRFAILFVSVDPDRDTPADIGRYVTLFGTPILGLTASEKELAPMLKAYGIFAQKVLQPGGDYTVDHTASTYLMDAKGGFFGTIDHDEADASALEKLKRLIG